MRLVKLLILGLITSFSLNGLTQEICDNGIDDDGDGLIDLNDEEDCECVSIIGESLIPNPSFEDTLCCPDRPGMLSCADTWIQASFATSDFYHSCTDELDIFPDPMYPLPGGGEGYVGFYSYGTGLVFLEYGEYVGTCIDSPMLAGETYVLNLWTAYSLGSDELDLSIFGTPNCFDLPWDGGVCPEGIGDWELLDNVLVEYEIDGTWQEVTLVFTPTVDIYAIAIGGSCDPEIGLNYYYIDELILVDSVALFFITESGGWYYRQLRRRLEGQDNGIKMVLR